jgi:LPS sulfotransferase NodH
MKSYMICTTPRTGGNWLDTELTQAGLGEPDEWLRYLQAEGYCNRDGIHWAWDEHTVNDIFGIKVHWNERYGLRFIDALPPGPHLYVHLVRVDSYRQAKSWLLARQHQTWFEKPPVETTDARSVESCRADLRHMNGCWQQWFMNYGIEPVRVTYEQMLMNITRVVERIGDLITELPDSPAVVGTRRLRHSGMRRHIA